MAILIDYSQTVIASFCAMSKGSAEVDEDLLRHTILNMIRQYRNQFSKKFGEVVICCDHYKNWRKDIFPQYKANRKKGRDASEMDWQKLFECLNVVRDEIKENMPYRVVQVEGAEADDIIATLCTKQNPTVIVSSDKDFLQLQKYDGVSQWSPIMKKYLKGDPAESLYEKIIKGDSGDGVPNILSPDETFVSEDMRQRPISKKKMDAWRGKTPEEFCDTHEILRNYYRNKQMVDLSEIPESLRINILTEYENQSEQSRSNLMNYFISKRLKNLMEHIEEF